MGVVHKRVNLTITRRSRAFSARWSKFAAALLCLVLVFCCCIFSPAAAMPETGRIWGKVLDPQGSPVENAHVKILNSSGALTRESTSDSLGNFSFEHIDIGQYRIVAEYPSFAAVTVGISILAGRPREINLQFRQLAAVAEAITVEASVPSSLTPDPGESVIIHDQVLDANPGRPGAPISLPGLPIETASGGIKAPQYFAPGVAGDHGEPIAQFFQVGNFLYPNNLPANAHGNGYADPNFLIPATIEAVSVDGGAFNVREGNNAVDLAATYIPRQRLASFLQLTADYRDADLVAGWSPRDPAQDTWISLEASYGNGFLERLEHRQQYKVNALRGWHLGRHQLTVFGIGYDGFSYVPGLIPIAVPVPDDTIDPFQLDHTNTVIMAAADVWNPSEQKQLSFAGFFREYALDLQSDFGAGLIKQSESRTVAGGESTYFQHFGYWLSVLAGIDLRRDAPRNLDLQHVDAEGLFQPVTANNLTLSFVEPFFSLDGAVGKHLHYDVGVRQEEIWMDNQDLINPQNSFDKLAPLTLPKGTITFLPPDRVNLPDVAFSYGEAFHTEDPRIGTGTGQPALLAPSRAYQVVMSKTIDQTQFRVTLKRVSNSQELAKIDPDTGLREDVGPSLNRVLSVSLQRNFSRGAFYASYSQADARDQLTGEPVPEAPRTIWDAVASINRLRWRLQARGEFEYVKAKPLEDGFIGVPVREIRGAVIRQFKENRMAAGADFLLASGYTGQTTETLALPGEPAPFERVVGVPLKSYISLSLTYFFRK